MTGGLAEIRDLEVQIRDFITEPRISHALFKEPNRFHVLASALDAIGDSTLAIAAYDRLEDQSDDGFNYIVVYGILQILFVRADAAKHILESLDIPMPQDDFDLQEVSEVKEIRNNATGHPTRRGYRNEWRSSHAIARHSLRTKSFRMLSATPDDTKFEGFDIPELIRRQHNGIVKILKLAANRLRERETEHRMKFKDQKLKTIFVGHNISYEVEKLFEACHGSSDRKAMAAVYTQCFLETIEKFRGALTERGILPAYDALRQDIEAVEYPLRELKTYFETGTAPNELSGEIFTFFLQHKLPKLIQTAAEFDKEYEKELS